MIISVASNSEGVRSEHLALQGKDSTSELGFGVPADPSEAGRSAESVWAWFLTQAVPRALTAPEGTERYLHRDDKSQGGKRASKF